MAFKLTYSDGQETDYDDDTAWEVDDGVLKMGRTEGEWTVLVSPSHWAVIEVGNARLSKDEEDESDESKDTKDEGEGTDAEAKGDDEDRDEDKDDKDKKDD